jgi:hypothetical protein
MIILIIPSAIFAYIGEKVTKIIHSSTFYKLHSNSIIYFAFSSYIGFIFVKNNGVPIRNIYAAMAFANNSHSMSVII